MPDKHFLSQVRTFTGTHTCFDRFYKFTHILATHNPQVAIELYNVLAISSTGMIICIHEYTYVRTLYIRIHTCTYLWYICSRTKFNVGITCSVSYYVKNISICTTNCNIISTQAKAICSYTYMRTYVRMYMYRV